MFDCLLLIIVIIVLFYVGAFDWLLLKIFEGRSRLRGGGNESAAVPANTTPKFKIYYSPDCSYCTRALELLDEKHANYEKILITDLPTQLAELDVPSSHKTKPIIFMNDKFLGGFTELKAYFDTI
jgi:glutaredoxin